MQELLCFAGMIHYERDCSQKNNLIPGRDDSIPNGQV